MSMMLARICRRLFTAAIVAAAAVALLVDVKRCGEYIKIAVTGGFLTAPGPSSSAAADNNDDGTLLVFEVSASPDEEDIRRVVALVASGGSSSSSSSSDNNSAARTSSPSRSPFQNCSMTRQMKIDTTSSEGPWNVQTFDGEGSPKHVGGDEFYVQWFSERQNGTTTAVGSSNVGWKAMPNRERIPDAVARVSDLANGRYRLDFFEPPDGIAFAYAAADGRLGGGGGGGGTLVVHFEFSCGIGAMSRPSRDEWVTDATPGAGAILSRAAARTRGPPPAVEPFVPPNGGGGRIDSGRIDLAGHNKVILFGDSVMKQFAGFDLPHDPSHKLRQSFLPGHISFKAKPETSLNTRTVPKFLSLIEKHHKEELNVSETRSGGGVGLVLGSGAWDLLRPIDSAGGGNGTAPPTMELEFRDHFDACRNLIGEIRKLYKGVAVYWKSMTPVFQHHIVKNYCWVKDPTCRDRTMYMSNSRSEFLYRKQKELMRELGVPFLDLYGAAFLSGHMTRNTGDGLHFNEYLNRLMLSWYHSGVNPPRLPKWRDKA